MNHPFILEQDADTCFNLHEDPFAWRFYLPNSVIVSIVIELTAMNLGNPKDRLYEIAFLTSKDTFIPPVEITGEECDGDYVIRYQLIEDINRYINQALKYRGEM